MLDKLKKIKLKFDNPELEEEWTEDLADQAFTGLD